MQNATERILSWLSQPNERRLLKLYFPRDDGPQAGLLVNRLVAEEAVSRDFTFTVTLLSDDAGIELKDVQCKMVCVELLRGDLSSRYFNGYCFEFSLQSVENGLATYQMVLKPWLALFRLRSDYHLFHNLSIEAQSKEMFLETGLASYELRIQESDPVRTFSCQYGESDYNYLHRRWEEMGWHYWYEHTLHGHKLIISSNSRSAAPIDGKPLIHFHHAGGSNRHDKIAHWRAIRKVVSGKVALAGFDFKKPAPQLANHGSSHQQGEIHQIERFEYVGSYGFKDTTHGKNIAERKMEQVDAEGKVFHGHGDSRFVQSGRWFGLQAESVAGNTTDDAGDNEFFILSASHRVDNNYLNAAGTGSRYENDFTAQRRNVVWRPAPGFNSSVPKTSGCDTATVVGPAGEEIYCDEYGRIKIAFHWDKHSKNDERSSCWVRVMTPWANSHFGMIAVPRVGTEVVVDFLQGNPDRPMVIGQLYNQRHMPPWDLPAHKTQTGILSRSSKGGSRANANAIRFEDRKGAEQFWLHAEKDFLTEVEHDEKKWVGGDRVKTVDHDETSHIKHNRNETVYNDEAITVAQNQSVKVDGEHGLKVAEKSLIQAGQKLALAAGTVLKQSAPHVLTLGESGITLKCGGSSIKMTPSMIEFNAPLLKFANAPLKNTPLEEVKPIKREIESTFAWDQLTGVAKRCTKAEFVALLVPVFGYDIPAKVYIKLYDGLRNGSIVNAKHKIVTAGHYPAAFDNATREIRVHWAAADAAANDKGASWDLLIVLLHEFGHYIDLILRKDLGGGTLAADAEGDEGAKYAYAIAFYDLGSSEETTYASYTAPEYSGPLKVNYAEARQAIMAAQGEEAQRNEGKQGSEEYFGAGRGEHAKDNPTGSFGHQSIEDALAQASAKFNDKEVREQIYFGNWLRDFSQVLDPKIVRNPNAPKDLAQYISREALTKVIDILAEDEFVHQASDKAKFTVTPKLLGVYRPTEHIDNPTNNDPKATDPRAVDPDFEPLPTKAYLAVNPATSMKSYITASVGYMQGELNQAVAAGASPEGYRHFGGALHVLEDYFAHSNFVELSLRKLGHKDVLPWTSAAPGKYPFPIVTGMFDSEDVIASTAGLIADTIFNVKWEFEATEPGKRNKSDRIMLILLAEHKDPSYLKTFKDFLWLRDKFASIPGHKALEWLMHYTIGMVGNVYNFVFNSLLHLMGNSVDDGQVYGRGDPNTNGSTDPSHSQLAKDHDNHPFHTLAATLAKEAVKKVGTAMAARWGGDATANPAAVAAGFIVHPMDCTWQDPIVTQWASTHAKEIKRGASSTEWEALRKEHEKEVRDKINEVGQRSKATWDYINKNYDELFGEKNQVKK